MSKSWYQECSSLQQSKLRLHISSYKTNLPYIPAAQRHDKRHDHIPLKINVTSHWIMLPLSELSKRRSSEIFEHRQHAPASELPKTTSSESMNHTFNCCI